MRLIRDLPELAYVANEGACQDQSASASGLLRLSVARWTHTHIALSQVGPPWRHTLQCPFALRRCHSMSGCSILPGQFTSPKARPRIARSRVMVAMPCLTSTCGNASNEHLSRRHYCCSPFPAPVIICTHKAEVDCFQMIHLRVYLEEGAEARDTISCLEGRISAGSPPLSATLG